MALQDLLLQCGIGASPSTPGMSLGDSSSAQTSAAATAESVVVQHRALVFFQMKSMMDIVEEDLLRRRMPSVTYLRLDGSVPLADRQRLVDRFNGDISIDLLLLTTAVGE